MFVACSTLCFASEPLESALRWIAELEFDKYELAVVEDGGHFRPSEVGDDPEAALLRLKRGPALVPSSLHVDFGPVDWDDPVSRARFDGICRFAKGLGVAVLTINAAPAGTPFDKESQRLASLVETAAREGLVIAPLTSRDSVFGDPAAALKLCQAIPGLGLTFDPSHYLLAGRKDSEIDPLFPYARNVHLRDTGKNPEEFQVRIGQGKLDYARVVNQLQRHGYRRSLTVAIFDRPENDFDREVEVRKLRLLLETML